MASSTVGNDYSALQSWVASVHYTGPEGFDTPVDWNIPETEEDPDDDDSMGSIGD